MCIYMLEQLISWNQSFCNLLHSISYIAAVHSISQTDGKWEFIILSPLSTYTEKHTFRHLNYRKLFNFIFSIMWESSPLPQNNQMYMYAYTPQNGIDVIMFNIKGNIY